MSKAFIAAEMAMFAAQREGGRHHHHHRAHPGQSPAPMLITEEMVKSMKKGSVIVDLAAENGGNCALTTPGMSSRTASHIIGYVDLPSRLAPTASQLYGSNLVHLLADMGGGKNFWHVEDDEVVRGASS
jgi:NAD(P) transhydrogenase subunit alpha